MATEKKKNDQMPHKIDPLIILTAGGTGGHIYPAESLAEELIKRGCRVALVTDTRGKDNYKGKLGEIENFAVSAGALVGKSKWFKLKSLFKTCFGVLQAMLILLKQKPACVVGFGGYASFPCSIAAAIMGVPLVIHEQNSVMSRTNRWLAKFASLIALSFKNTRFTPKNKKTVLTGMPIRKAIVDIKNNPYPKIKDHFQIFVLGGSQGAKVFGDVVPSALKSLSPNLQKKIKLIQQGREADLPEIKKAYKGFKGEVVLSHFFNNMPELYSTSHLIISRAGASSVSEILAVGLPSILVPLPTAADDHQTYNAEDVGRAKAGIVIKQKDFSAEKLSQLLSTLISDDKQLQTMSDHAKKIGITDAAIRLANAIEKDIIK